MLSAQPPAAAGTLVSTPRGRRLAATLVLAVLLTLAGGVLAPPSAHATPLPDGFSEEFVATGFQIPVSIQFSPDGRIFVAERHGLIKVLDGIGDTTPAVFADLRTEVYSYYDRGLLGFALDRASRPTRTRTCSTPTTGPSAAPRRGGTTSAPTRPGRTRTAAWPAVASPA